MAFGRRTRPSLLRTATRAAVITGSATAASNAVNARAQAPAAAPLAAPVAAAPVAVVAAAPVAEATEDIVTRIERLAALHSSGALTDAEFTALKAQAIAG